MESMPLTPFDILVIIVIAVSGLLAFSRGFVTEVLSIFAWGGAALATLYGLPLFQPWARTHIKPEALADVIVLVALAIISLILLKILARFIGDRVRQSHIGALDRALGVLFGLLRGLLIVCIAYIVISWVIPRPDQPDWIRQSKSRPLIEFGSGILRDLMPSDIARDIAPYDSDEEIRDILKDMQRNMPAPQQNNEPGKKGYDQKVRDGMDKLLKDI